MLSQAVEKCNLCSVMVTFSGKDNDIGWNDCFPGLVEDSDTDWFSYSIDFLAGSMSLAAGHSMETGVETFARTGYKGRPACL